MRPAYEVKELQEPFDQQIALLAARQHGVFTGKQAQLRGATRNKVQRRIETGRWERLYVGVYRLAGTVPTVRQGLLAGCFAWGTGTVISHRSAAVLWGLPGFDAWTAIELTVRRGKHRNWGGHVVHWLYVPPTDIGIVDAIPVTTPTRTLLDLASLGAQDMVEEALDDALRRKLTSLPRMQWYLESRAQRGRRGVAMVRGLLDARDPATAVPDSVFETRLLRLMKRAGLPRPELQHAVKDGTKLVAVVDFAFPSRKVAIEADGYRWHSGRLRWEHDLHRRNALTALGWRVVHVTWRELVDRPRDVVRAIERALKT